MEKIKQYPKLALASLLLLLAPLVMFWMNWVTISQSSFIGLLVQAIPALEDGGLSFAAGREVVGDLAELSRRLNGIIGQSAGSAENTALFLMTLLNIIYQILFFGTFLATGYCLYARLKWKSGYTEGIYFLFLLGDLAIMYMVVGQLNSLCGSGTFKLGFWGIAAVICGLLSEILWEEASFNTPNPLLAPTAKQE